MEEYLERTGHDLPLLSHPFAHESYGEYPDRDFRHRFAGDGDSGFQVREYFDYFYQNGLEDTYEVCISDKDCCPSCLCKMIDPMLRFGECTHAGDFHASEFGHRRHNDEQANTERGHFEIGYWCLKDADCESKKCA